MFAQPSRYDAGQNAFDPASSELILYTARPFQVAVKKCKQTSCNIAVLSGACIPAVADDNQFLQLSPPTAAAAGYYDVVILDHKKDMLFWY